MSIMTEDCVFLASVGDKFVGKQIVGQKAAREALAAVLSDMSDAS